MPPHQMNDLKVAIAGGGIASLCLAHKLTRMHPNWKVKIFEASPGLRNESLAIGLASNAQTALSLLSPELRVALDEAGAVVMDPSARIMMGTGPDSGHHIGDITHEVKGVVVHRGLFWRSLHKLVLDRVVEFGKKLSTVESLDGDSRVRLCFEDGTFYEADALVGCDGINSVTRHAVLGAEHPAATPKYTNMQNFCVVIPIAEARGIFGEEYCRLQTQYGWIGDGGVLITDHADGGKSMQVIAGLSIDEVWPHSAPYVEWPKEKLEEGLLSWGKMGRAVAEVFKKQSKLYTAATRTHLDTPTYCKGRICVAGDAAQTFPPAQGAGAGQAIEDALMLSTVLGCCKTTEDIPRAFEIYDSMRRPRRKSIAESSEWAHQLLVGRAPNIGLDVDRIAAQLPT